MASKSPNIFCGICSRRSRFTKAVKYCTDCEDGLCSDCLDFHGHIKTVDTHHIIDIDVIEGKSFVVSKSCKIHTDMVLEYFCSDHDALCCRSCMASAHRSCDRLLPIEVSAKGVKSSTMYEEIVKDVATLNSAINELEDKKRQGMTNLKDSKLAIKEDVKAKLQKLIQEIEAALMSEIDKIHTDLSNEANDNLEKICDRKRKIQHISEQFQSVSKHGSESQIFMLINNIKEDLNSHANDFQEFLSSQKDASLWFKESDLLSAMKSFGSVEIKEASHDFKYKPLKVQQAQFLQQQRRLPTKFQLDVKFKVPGASFAGIGVTKDNRLIMCNRSSSSLFVMSDKGKKLATIQMDGTQWGIAIEEDNNTAWVTLPDKQSVQTVDIATMKKGRLIKVPCYGCYCYGIAIIDGQIAVGGYGKIYIISKTGDLKKILDVKESPVYSISVGQKSQLYFAQADMKKSKLKSVGLNGTVDTISAEDTYTVIGVKSDRIGNAFLLECDASNLKLFSSKDRSLKTILTSKDGLNRPYGFAFSNDFSKLFISNYSVGDILVFLSN